MLEKTKYTLNDLDMILSMQSSNLRTRINQFVSKNKNVKGISPKKFFDQTNYLRERLEQKFYSNPLVVESSSYPLLLVMSNKFILPELQLDMLGIECTDKPLYDSYTNANIPKVEKNFFLILDISVGKDAFGKSPNAYADECKRLGLYNFGYAEACAFVWEYKGELHGYKINLCGARCQYTDMPYFHIMHNEKINMESCDPWHKEKNHYSPSFSMVIK
ncbi:MAG: hypothetical protein ABIG10_00480 [bacterium]